MADLTADFTDGQILTAAELNQWKDNREGNILPISPSTYNYTSATYDIGSATYKWRHAYYSGTVEIGNINIATNTISTTSGALTLSPLSGHNININLATTGDFAVNTNQLYVDTSTGIVGISAIPSDWGSNYKAIEIGGAVSYLSSQSQYFGMYSNSYRNSGGDWIYKINSGAAGYIQDIGPHKWFVAGTGTAGNTINYSQEMTLTSAGNVGIGTPSPLEKLHVIGNSKIEGLAPYIELLSTAWGSAAYIQTGVSDTGLALGDFLGLFYPTTKNFSIGSLGGSKMVITSGGGVGIGTTNPGASKLAVAGDIDVQSTSNTVFSNNFANYSSAANMRFRSGSTYIVFETDAGNTERMRITQTGNVGIGETAPTAKLHVAGDIHAGDAIRTGYGVSTGDANIELGYARSGDGNAYVDFHSVSGGDYNLRIIRNSGANGTSAIQHNGTGTLSFIAAGAATINFDTNSVTRLAINSSGKVALNAAAASGMLNLPDHTTAADGIYVGSDVTLYRSAADNLKTDDTFIATGGIDAGGNGTAFKTKIIELGDWNMDTTGILAVAHGLTLANIRYVKVTIRRDDAANFFDLTSPFSGGGTGGYIDYIDGTNINLGRTNGGYFDSANFDSTSYNRGWLTIFYV